jgi:hypothetical protein
MTAPNFGILAYLVPDNLHPAQPIIVEQCTETRSDLPFDRRSHRASRVSRITVLRFVLEGQIRDGLENKI